MFDHFFGPIFDHFSDHFWGHFGDHFGTIRPKKERRWAQAGHQELQRPQIPAFAKTLKNNCFLMFLGSRGLPREIPQAHEGSQEAPKELQDLKKKSSKPKPEKYKFWDSF